MLAGDHLIEARGLVKRFGDFVAVDGIDLAVDKGEVFGFLGPNGAGKTSTIRMIGCVSPVTDGELSVLGMDPTHQGAEIRSRLGVVSQDDNLDSELTVVDNLVVYGRYFDMARRDIAQRATELLDFAQLSDRRDDKVDPLSGGMKRRLTIARALVNRPDLVLLDEPTTGLDPQARHLLWERLYQLKSQGVTQVLSTHYMDEAEQLCDRLVIMDEGRIVALGSPSDLIREHSTREVLELRFGDDEARDHALERIDGVAQRVEPLADRVLLYTPDGDAALSRLGEAGVNPTATLIRRATLEDVFLRLTGRNLEE